MALLLGMSTKEAESQVQPAARYPHINWKEAAKSGLLADVAARGLDVYSTRRMLKRGGEEDFLPDSISHHAWAMAGYGAAVVAADWLVARELRKHNHPRLARLVVWGDAAQDGWWAGRNFWVGRGGGKGQIGQVGNPSARGPKR
jgi:hypothetical protein